MPNMQVQRFKLLTAFQVIVMVPLTWLLIRFPAPWDAQRYVGTAMALTGFIFIAIARFQLGKSFSIRPEAHELVTKGLYSRIRNPIYVFGTVALAGVFLVLHRPALWVTWSF